MAKSRREQEDKEICNAIKELVDGCNGQVSLIKNRWRENYDMFVYGSQNEDKEDWQTKFSVNKLQTSIYAAQGRLVNILVNTPDWYELCPRSGYNMEAEQMRTPFMKLMDYYLTSSRFKKHAGTFFLCALIATGSMHFGWKQRLVQNPEFVLEATEKQRQEIQQRLAKNVTNPQVEDDSIDGDNFENELLSAISDFNAEAMGQPVSKKKVEPYIQVGCLDLMDINHEDMYWDPNVQYMEDSQWKAFDYEVNRWELEQAANLGFFSKAQVKKIGQSKDLYITRANDRLRYKNTMQSPRAKSDLVKLTVYYGPLIVKGKVKKDRYYAVIANDSIILRSGDYPYWEPPGHHTPIVTAAVRQIPYRATGAGIGDNAVALQKIYDSNWQLICDTFRFGIAGINVVNYTNLVDKSQLLEGIYPGMTLEVRGTPKDSFEHINLTSNVENQSHPVQSMLEGAIDNLTGINEMMTGGSNQYSRTPASETNARLDAGNQNVNIIALDLEQNFIIPALETVFARILQFGLSELNSNPELQALFDEEEMQMLQQLNADKRLTILNHWYRFKIKGFSGSQDKDAQAQRDNELLAIVNGGGLLGQLINLPEFLKRYFENRDIKDPEKLLLLESSPIAQVTQENQVLMGGHMVMPAPEDDHDLHIQMHGPLAQSPYATPAMQAHFQQHMQIQQQMQMQQQGAPQQGQPPNQQMQ